MSRIGKRGKAALLQRTPTGVIACCCQELARYAEFGASMTQLGIEVGRTMGEGWTVNFYYGADVAFSRHRAVSEFLADESREYLWFIDDDHAFRPQILGDLLRHKVDIVAPLCLKKHHPFPPTAAIDEKPIGLQGRAIGLREVHTIGAAGLLVHRSVFEALEPPYFRAGAGAEGRLDEDRDFCKRARDAGYKVMVDTSLPLAHSTVAAVLPSVDEDGTWYALFITHGTKGPNFIPLPLDESYLEETEPVTALPFEKPVVVA